MQMEIGENDSNAKLNRQMAFDDNMEVVWQMVNEIHNKQYDITDFELVSLQTIKNLKFLL